MRRPDDPDRPHGPRGVVFPEMGRSRSTSAVGRAVVRAGLAAVDPAGAPVAAVDAVVSWRKQYAGHFRQLVESGLGSARDAEAIAEHGLAQLRRSMRWRESDGAERALDAIGTSRAGGVLVTERIAGTAPADPELTIVVNERRLRGRDLLAQLDAWTRSGALEPSAAEAISVVARHPEWLSLSGRTVVCLGAAAELSPLPCLLSWGATVAAIDLPRPDVWRRLGEAAKRSAGTLLVPTSPGFLSWTERAGVDLVTDLPAALGWVGSLSQRLVLGSYVYADGAAHVTASTASDLLAEGLRHAGRDLALAFLATPTDVFAVSPEAAQAAVRAHRNRGAVARGLGATLGLLSGGRLLSPNYPATSSTSGSALGGGLWIHDALVLQQGPNYALAKRIQRWRATIERAAGRTVSLNVAPPTRTRSVTKNRALAAAYAGARLFGVQVFEPETTRGLMAALLVHDLHAANRAWDHPWQAEANQAIHGGLWRAAYSPRSALGLAAAAGLLSAGNLRAGGGSRRSPRGETDQ
ncbi:MAG: hypothetical protein ACRCYU_07230 [Nocardioides sp.]